MDICVQCDGIGYIEDYECGRYFQDDCYHCMGLGKVDEQTSYQDKLGMVAHYLATLMVNEIVKNKNSNPDGEGWSFSAAENMMTDTEYFQYHINYYLDDISNKLFDMNESDQQLLIAWLNMLNEHRGSEPQKKISQPVLVSDFDYQSDDILF